MTTTRERLCEVTVLDSDGKPHTARMMASSTYRAACYYFSRACGEPGSNLPRPNNNTEYQVQIVGEDRIYRVSHRKMMEWANREAERALRRKEGLR